LELESCYIVKKAVVQNTTMIKEDKSDTHNRW